VFVNAGSPKVPSSYAWCCCAWRGS
jgi:hypothetical protein